MKISGVSGFLCLILLYLSSVRPAHGQQTSPIINAALTGQVIDAQSKEPIEGATIQLEAVTHQVKTDEKGEFQFVTGQKLPFSVTVSFLGYKKKTLVINNSPAIIELEADTEGLEEVVVVGYGTQKKRNLTGAIATIDSDFLANRPITNASQALQGANGVYVNQTKGRPGAENNTIRIRGGGHLE